MSKIVRRPRSQAGRGCSSRCSSHGNGNLTGVSDPSASYAFEYDGDRRVTSVDNQGTSNVPRTVLTFGYDLKSNRTSVSDDRGGQVTYTYDVAHRMTGAQLYLSSLNVTATAALSYDAADRLTGISRTNSGGGGSGGSGGSATVSTAYNYDAADRVTGITHTAGYSTLAGYTLAWDAAGQLTQEVSNDGTVNFTYDSGGQLTGASGWRSEGYTYDGLGNRTMSGYQTGTGNRLASDGTFNYTYENEGNLLTKTEISTGKVTEFTWDHRNRLTKVQAKDSQGTVFQESNYTYDAFDKRIGVSDDPDGPGPQPAAQRWTVYDGLNPYADFDGSGTLTRRYLYGPAVDMVLARLDTAGTGTIAWYLTDHLGTVRDLADTTGQVIDHIQYDSFGKVLSESNLAAGDRFKFIGREYDAATGQYYYRARYYDAAVGRFLGEDPSRFQDDINLYRYVGNHPTMAIDPSGLAEQFSWGMLPAKVLGSRDTVTKTERTRQSHTYQKMEYAPDAREGWTAAYAVTYQTDIITDVKTHVEEVQIQFAAKNYIEALDRRDEMAKLERLYTLQSLAYGTISAQLGHAASEATHPGGRAVLAAMSVVYAAMAADAAARAFGAAKEIENLDKSIAGMEAKGTAYNQPIWVRQRTWEEWSSTVEGGQAREVDRKLIYRFNSASGGMEFPTPRVPFPVSGNSG